MKDRFEDLNTLSRLVLDRELAKLREISNVMASYATELARLKRATAERKARVERAEAQDDLALSAGRDFPWKSWVERERARITIEMSRAAADFEAQKLAARYAFGRAEALRAISSKETAQRKKMRQKNSGSDTENT